MMNTTLTKNVHLKFTHKNQEVKYAKDRGAEKE